MKFFFSSFFFFLSYGLNTGHTQIYAENKFYANKVFSNECLSGKKIECVTDEECQSFILESKCIENLCKCSGDAVLSSDASKCLPPATEYESFCEDNIQCSNLLSVGGVCENNQCICKSGYHYLKGSCWKNSDLNEKCFRDEQCFSAYEYVGLTCENNVCKCRDNYYQRLNSGCRRKRYSEETCNLDADCVDHTVCENMICSELIKAQRTLRGSSNISVEKAGTNFACSKGTFELNGDCVLELGMKCDSNKDCAHIKNAYCLDNSVCACEPVKYVASENNRECLQVSRGNVEDIYRTSCKKDPQCGVFGGNSICQNRRCTCKNGTYFENENKFCWTIKALKESCVDTKDCYPSVSHAECVETKSGKFCNCQKGYHLNGLTCLLDALEVGEPCINDGDCFFPNSFCNASRICDCKEQYFPENGKCIPGVGAFCVTNTNCAHLTNTECKTGNLQKKQCLCLENHTNSVDYKYCLPVVKFKEKCVESFQCKFPKGDQGICKGSICECREGEHYAEEKCYKSKFVGESCLSRLQCFPENDTNSVICLKGFCSCNYDYKLDQNGICVKTNSATMIKFYSVPLTSLVFLLTLRG